jgi:hypothetical protein
LWQPIARLPGSSLIVHFNFQGTAHPRTFFAIASSPPFPKMKKPPFQATKKQSKHFFSFDLPS